MEIARHSSIDVTMNVYGHVTLDEKRDALNRVGGPAFVLVAGGVRVLARRSAVVRGRRTEVVRNGPFPNYLTVAALK